MFSKFGHYASLNWYSCLQDISCATVNVFKQTKLNQRNSHVAMQITGFISLVVMATEIAFSVHGIFC